MGERTFRRNNFELLGNLVEICQQRPRHARHNLPISEYQGVYDAYKADGYRIAHFSAHRAKSTTYVAAIWIKQDGYNPAARHNMTECQLQNERRQAFNDCRPICITGYLDSGGTKYGAYGFETPGLF